MNDQDKTAENIDLHDPRIVDSIDRYWRKNMLIMVLLLTIWAVVGLGCGVLLADRLNNFSMGGFPLGFWFAQQGSIIVFILLILAYSVLLNRLDARHAQELQQYRADRPADPRPQTPDRRPQRRSLAMSIQSWTFLFVGLTFSLYLVIAWLSRVRDTEGFYVAGRGVPAIANGMATAADWMSAASFISMAGLIATMGYAGGVYLMGWTGGYVLLALLLAPYLRKFGHYTVPDFIGDRYESNVARLVAVVCAIFVSFTYVAGQMRGVGIVFSRFLEVDINVGVTIGMVIVFIYATLGGMKGITWTQVAQYWVLITAFLIPAIAISIRLTGQPIPQIGMGSQLLDEGVFLLDKLDQIHTDLGFAAYTETFTGSWDKINVFCAVLALMVGTAGLPTSSSVFTR